MGHKATRYDTNRKIKQILVRYSTDLSKVVFSFTGKSARFSGRFLKTSGKEMKIEEVEDLCRNLTGIAGIRFFNFDIDDWAISAGMGAMSITKKAAPSGSESHTRKSHHIDTHESVETVIKDEFGEK